jgi:hypothetical protein
MQKIDEKEASRLLDKLKEAILIKDDLAIEILYTRLIRAGFEVVEDSLK